MNGEVDPMQMADLHTNFRIIRIVCGATSSRVRTSNWIFYIRTTRRLISCKWPRLDHNDSTSRRKTMHTKRVVGSCNQRVVTWLLVVDERNAARRDDFKVILPLALFLHCFFHARNSLFPGTRLPLFRSKIAWAVSKDPKRNVLSRSARERRREARNEC